MPKPLDLSGIFPPVCTPFTSDDRLALEEMQSNLASYERIPFRGYVVLGSNGEFPYLSVEEKLDLLKFVRRQISDDKLLIAGAGAEGTKLTIDLCHKFAEVGCNAALVITPSFYKNRMTSLALERFYLSVANSSPIPIIFTNVEIEPDTVLRLASHPNIIGLKDSGGNIAKLSYLCENTKNHNFQILAGSAGFLLPALQAGCVGGVCALANVLGDQCCHLYELFKHHKLTEARTLQASLVQPNTMVTRKFGVPALKYIMDEMGLFGGPVRSPLVPLTVSEADVVRAEFVKHGFIQD